ncbi:MAG: bifunctional 2-polyprenyl-6-hydroxyphenol methylase/3-demethylubiquinol 3-O-methyltransferase UbiG [Polyangiaceae bacterium]|nr:bifunctional 2-polyprenyl-6-hydroxyphenol methylase/3-demethylubiquinol 3-O-methyltransferase UbiG [Polyangiaceae bacterium]
MATTSATTTPAPLINNDIYESLGERWYTAKDDPVALLRAESAHRIPWVTKKIEEVFGPTPAHVLDVGCGAGFLSNALAQRNHHVIGVDASAGSLAVARRHDSTKTVRYELADAHALPFAKDTFDVACAMDFLEHVEEPARVIVEIARVLRPGGLFFFHTFNRTRLAWLIAIKGVEWFVRNTPRDLHVLRLFLNPKSVSAMCEANGMVIKELRGCRPVVSKSFLRMLMTGVVPSDFAFTFTPSTRIAYMGMAERVC